MQRFIKPLAIVVALLLAGGGAGLVLRSDRTGTYRITAYFEKAIGLFPNSDVTILGVPVGTVTRIEPEGSRVKVVLEVSDEHEVPADAFAQIVPISVIADRFVQLHPPYTGGPVMEDGTVLDTDRTQIPAELDDVFKQLKKLLEAIEPGEEGEPGALGELIVQLDDALRDRETDLKGAVTNTAQLTGTLADAQTDLSDLLVNLDRLFGKLAQRAGTIGSLNQNFAIVMSTLAESRSDLEATLANLGDMTGEIGRVLRSNRERLGTDLALASRVLDTLLQNRASVEESLSWLPVVAIGLSNAYNPDHDDIDVRDNAAARLKCDILDELPDNPVKDAFEQLCREHTGEPPPDAQDAQVAPEADEREPRSCREGVRKVKRQLHRLERVDLPASVLDDVVKPLKKKLRKLARECKELGKAIEDPGALLDELSDDIGGIPSLEEPPDDAASLTGNAAGPTIVPPSSSGGGFRRWLAGFFSFLGGSS
ncbi:MAG TPA: MCE family protein [Actinomycetota bacterium]|nr:MCE family protein [Actinomycetota bacterium]